MYQGIEDLLKEAARQSPEFARRLAYILNQLIDQPEVKKMARQLLNDFVLIDLDQLESMINPEKVEKVEQIEPVEVESG